MSFKPALVALASMLVVQPVTAQQRQQNVQILAQAYDRCMATYAVRLTKTPATDEEIYSQAAASCAPLDGQLRTALNAQLEPAQAAEIFRSIDEQAKPNFMATLAQIRSDRAGRSGG